MCRTAVVSNEQFGRFNDPHEFGNRNLIQNGRRCLATVRHLFEFLYFPGATCEHRSISELSSHVIRYLSETSRGPFLGVKLRGGLNDAIGSSLIDSLLPELGFDPGFDSWIRKNS